MRFHKESKMYLVKTFFLKQLNFLTMTTFHLSHFEINDDKHPLGRGRVLYELIARLITHIERWCRPYLLPILGSRNATNLVVMHIRLGRQWRSLTSGNEKRIL